MRSLSNVLDIAAPGAKSLSALCGKYGRHSVAHSIAEHDIREAHRLQGGIYGQLGEAGEVQPDAGGGYRMDTQLGSVILSDVSSPCEALTSYSSTVTLSAVRCFAAEDVETDELFAVVSLVVVNPTASGTDQMVTTMRTPIVETRSGDTVFRNTTLGNVPVVGSGISIHMALWDHESGDADEIRDKIAAAMEKAAKQAQQAIAAGALGNDAAVTAGKVGDVTEFEVGGIKPFHFLTLGLAEPIAAGLADDLLGFKSFYVPSSNLKEFADQEFYRNSIRTDPELPFDIQINWPPRAGQEEPFKERGAFYKAYFKIATTMNPVPCDPPLR